MGANEHAGASPDAGERYLRVAEVKERTRLSRSTIDRLEAAGEFPKRRQLTPTGSVGWLASEVGEWLKSRPVRRC